MRLPSVIGVIDRRVLVNYRVDPEVLRSILPHPFRPKLVRGFGIAGICLIRLKRVRPTGLPGWIGVSSENAAHRAAVEWNEGSTVREGVYIPRRDTNSWINYFAGGRIFPGVHHRATFAVGQRDDGFEISLTSDDRRTRMFVRGRRSNRLPETSVFRSLEEASQFFHKGAVGYSPTGDPSRLEGVELHCCNWEVQPLDVEEVRSSFFGDSPLFPAGSIQFDSALLMQDIKHNWRRHADLCCRSAGLPQRLYAEPAVADQ